MKKILTIIIVIFFKDLSSQNNLQFSQVISSSGSLLSNGSSTQILVPSNKVWKVESIHGQSDCGSRLGIVINNISIVSNNEIKFPIWLKSGDVFKVQVMVNPSTGIACGPFNYFYSIIEFNLTN